MSHAPISLKVGDSLSAYRIVRVNSSGQAAACSATTDVIAGVTVDEATKSNQAVPVAVGGVAKVYCNDTIAAGGLIMTDASGRGIPAVANTAGIYVLGTCLNTVSATGTLAEVLVNPFQVSVP
jgi:hypothetical protein